MSNNPSGTTAPVAFRLPLAVQAILAKRAKKQGLSVSEYLKRRVTYDTIRKHGYG